MDGVFYETFVSFITTKYTCLKILTCFVGVVKTASDVTLVLDYMKEESGRLKEATPS